MQAIKSFDLAKKKEPDFNWLLEALPWLKTGDFFVGGLDYFRSVWGLPDKNTVLQTTGTIQQLAELSGIDPVLQGADPGGFLVVSLHSAGLPVPLLIELFADLDIYCRYLEKRPLSYQRQAFSLRTGELFSDSTCVSFKDITRIGGVLKPVDLAEIAEISLTCRHSLLHLTEGAVFSPLSLRAFFEAGFAFWLEQFHFVSWFLEELMESEILERETMKWLKPLLNPMGFLEREGTAFWTTWQEQSGRRPLFMSPFVTVHRLKFLFLMMFADLKNLPLPTQEGKILDKVSSKRGWWDEPLHEMSLPPVFVAEWIVEFGEFYIEAFFLCGLHSLMNSRSFGFAGERFFMLLMELVNEEIFVNGLVQKSALSVISKSQAVMVLEQRWRGQVGTPKSLEDFLQNKTGF
jgi:hypothetical protein